MNFPSLEFDNTVAALCHGTATGSDTSALQAVLEVSESARDDYLWQVELHALLASRCAVPTVDEETIAHQSLRPAEAKPRPALRGSRVAWLITAAGLVAVIAGCVWWAVRNKWEAERNMAAKPLGSLPTTAVEPEGDGEAAVGGGSTMGIYRQNVAFVAATDAPVIVGTGRLDPIELGAKIPYSQDGSTLHVWDWSKSTQSRVLKDTRLWPQERFALSPDGRWFVWANGAVLDLTTDARTKIDLGGEYFFDNAGGKLERIQSVQFTPDGRRLALLISNLQVTMSAHPLRKQEFATTHSIQVVEFPAATLVCEFPASLPVAFSPDGKRVVCGSPAGKLDQQIEERSAETGEVLRKYEPHVREFTYALCWAPDGKRLAVFDGVGEVLVWETATRELAYRVNVRQATNSTAALRFSPDGKHLAIGLLQKIVVVDAATGAVEVTTATTSPDCIQWGADSKTFRVLSHVSIRGMAEGVDKSGRSTLSNMYPMVDPVDFEALRAKK